MTSKEKKNSIFTKILINSKVPLEFKYVNKLLTNNLLEFLRKKFEGKCCEEGYVKPNSISIVNYSSGIVKNNLIVFDVVFECYVCYLVEGMEINCVAKNITKAGIRAEIDLDKSPAVIFVARDHHYINKSFNDVKEGSNITVKIIGQRYELNDINISAIAEFLKINKISKKLTIAKDEETDESVKSKSSKKSTTKTKYGSIDDEPDDVKPGQDEPGDVEPGEAEQTVVKDINIAESKTKDVETEPVVATEELGKDTSTVNETQTDKTQTDETQTDETQADETQADETQAENVIDKQDSEDQQDTSSVIKTVKEEPLQVESKVASQEQVNVELDNGEPVNDDDEALEALKKLETQVDKEITIVPDSVPVKRKRGRPRKTEKKE